MQSWVKSCQAVNSRKNEPNLIVRREPRPLLYSQQSDICDRDYIDWVSFPHPRYGYEENNREDVHCIYAFGKVEHLPRGYVEHITTKARVKV